MRKILDNNYLVFIVALICLILGYILRGELSPKIQHTVSYDTVYVPEYVAIPPIDGEGEVTKQAPVYRTNPLNKELSRKVLTILRERDSLSALLQSDSVSVPVVFEDIHNDTKDTINIRYDEISSSIAYNIRFAPREVKVKTITQTITQTHVQEVTFWEKVIWFTGGIAAGYAINGVLR